MSTDQPPEAPTKPKRTKQGTNKALWNRGDPSIRPPGYLPPEIAAQPALHRKAFVLLCARPSRSLASIARELGISKGTIHVWSHHARWATHLERFVEQSTESLAFAAHQEAQRSRAELLASNRLAEATIDAALVDLIETDEHGNVRLKPGKNVADVQKLQQARQTHVKTTAMITGTDVAHRAAVAAAGATRIVMKVGSVVGEVVEQPARASVVVSDVVSPKAS